MKILFWVKRVVFTLAALWAILATVNILTVPMGVRVTTTQSADSAEPPITITEQTSWYESQGLWGIIVVITFAFMYIVNGFLAWWNYIPGLAVFSLLAVVFTLLAALSIGGLYAPSLLGVILGWFLIGLEKILSLRSKSLD